MAYTKDQVPKNIPSEGGQFTLTITPPIPPDCSISIVINDEQARPGDTVGDIKLISFGNGPTNSGATFEVKKNKPNADIKFVIKCPKVSAENVKFEIGEGFHPDRPEPFNPDLRRERPVDPTDDVAGPGARHR